jgi:hypothetical protein
MKKPYAKPAVHSFGSKTARDMSLADLHKERK